MPPRLLLRVMHLQVVAPALRTREPRALAKVDPQIEPTLPSIEPDARHHPRLPKAESALKQVNLRHTSLRSSTINSRAGSQTDQTLPTRIVEEPRSATCDLPSTTNRTQPPLFIDVATFGSSAEACARSAQGQAIAVKGQLIYREWVADDGTRRSKHAVVGRVQFGGKPNGNTPDTQDTEPGEETADF